MGSFAKKIQLNQVMLMDKKKIESGELPRKTRPLSVRQARVGTQIEKRASNIPKEDLKRVIGVARAHALWLHMTILKQVFRFTSTQLLTYHEKLQDVYKYAIDDTSGGTTEDIVRVTVHGSSKKTMAIWTIRSTKQNPLTKKENFTLTTWISTTTWEKALRSTRSWKEPLRNLINAKSLLCLY